MATTIKDIAKQTGVSIATVSHVINRTRYVSPELVKKVEDAINASDYKLKLDKKNHGLRSGPGSVIAAIVPFVMGTLYVRLIKYISEQVMKEGYLLATYVSDGDYELEKKILERVVTDKKTAGIILSPCRSDGDSYSKLLLYNIPIILLERAISGKEKDCVLAENEKALYKGTQHLLKSGHEKIAIITGSMETSTVQERLKGYKKALEESGITYKREDVLSLSHMEHENCIDVMEAFYQDRKPTAIITCGNQLTLMLLKTMQSKGLECPQDISVVGFGDEEWCELAVPPLTTITQNPEKMAYLAVKKVMDKINGHKNENGEIRIPLELTIRKSTQMIGRGPFGEKAFSPDRIALSEVEKEELKKRDFKVGISFHYSGTAWQQQHENGMRQTLEKLGITVVSVMDAHFDPYLQVTQLEGIAMQRPDALIAIPADDSITAPVFKKLSKQTKLLFLSNVPEGFTAEDYVSCVSVNERENGNIAGTLMGEYFKNRKSVKVGFINHGTSFYGTHLRDMVATQTICENYANIEIAAVSKFNSIEDTYEICRNMIINHPDIEGLYISWDRPALRAIKALEELRREDISIFTFDLDKEIGEYLAQGKFVKGMSTQRPYEQGVAIALATAKALLGHNHYKYIGVPPYMVQKKNILRAWKDIMNEPAPEELEKYFEHP